MLRLSPLRFVLFCLLFAPSLCNPFSVALQLARVDSPLSLVTHVVGQTVGYGQQLFVIATKSRAVRELFDSIEELKLCVQHPSMRKKKWWWSEEQATRDTSGCITGPLRAAAAMYLIRVNVMEWLVGDFSCAEKSRGGWATRTRAGRKAKSY